MVLILDEEQDGVVLLRHTTSPKTVINEWQIHSIDKLKSLPKDKEFNILLYKYDELSGVKLGCQRFINCQLNRVDLFEKTFTATCVVDKFYNNSEQSEIRADKIEGSLNV